MCLSLIYSVEMDSKKFVKTITISNYMQDKVLFEGTLGNLVDISIEKEGLLEVIGSNGTLRLAINVKKLGKNIKDVLSPS